MNAEELVKYFNKQIEKDDQKSSAVAAIETLLEQIKQDTAETLQELLNNLTGAVKYLVKTDCKAVTSVSSGCELFLRFITLASLEYSDLNKVKEILLHRGKLFLKKVSSARTKISKLGEPFLTDDMSILTHANSRVVINLLIAAASKGKRFKVFVTESNPGNSGHKLAQKLKDHGILVTVILDAAAGYIMEKIDLILVGAEGIVENGGIINKIGCYQVAVCAKAHNKPLYVLAESFKFVREYPLNQQDVPIAFKYKSSTIANTDDLDRQHPIVDYTPPGFVTLLISDLGVLTPSAVSDELIKLYL